MATGVHIRYCVMHAYGYVLNEFQLHDILGLIKCSYRISVNLVLGGVTLTTIYI